MSASVPRFKFNRYSMDVDSSKGSAVERNPHTSITYVVPALTRPRAVIVRYGEGDGVYGRTFRMRKVCQMRCPHRSAVCSE